MPGFQRSEPPALDSLVTDQQLPRDVFRQRLGSLHFVFLPYRSSGYYDLSASGALLDAVTWLKPVMTTNVPLTRALFHRYGDVGYLCDDITQMGCAIEEAISQLDDAYYQQMRHRLKMARDTRTPHCLAGGYREGFETGFGSNVPWREASKDTVLVSCAATGK
jgi:hypothetical protein